MSHAGETTMARYFGKARGKAISISTLGGMTGFILLPLIVVKLSKIFEAQYVWLIASLSIILFIPVLFYIYTDLSRVCQDKSAFLFFILCKFHP